jgi:hypothetical protein
MVGFPTGENLTQTIGGKTDKIGFCRQAYPFHRSTSIIPNLAAYRTISMVLWILSLRKIFDLWFSTVFGLMKSFSAICLLESPWASNAIISCSRAVKWS